MRVGLTQRVTTAPNYAERRDALDQRWAGFAEALGVVPIPLFNLMRDVDGYVAALGLDAVILSGGNDIAAPAGAPDAAPERDAFEAALLDCCAARGLPVIGVCRGLQMMQHHGGGPLAPVGDHAGTRHDIAWAAEVPARFRAGPVNSYHNFAVAAGTLAAGYRPLAEAGDGTVEAFVHERLPWLAIMWHPEREPAPVSCDVALIGHFLQGETI